MDLKLLCIFHLPSHLQISNSPPCVNGALHSHMESAILSNLAMLPLHGHNLISNHPMFMGLGMSQNRADALLICCDFRIRCTCLHLPCASCKITSISSKDNGGISQNNLLLESGIEFKHSSELTPTSHSSWLFFVCSS